MSPKPTGRELTARRLIALSCAVLLTSTARAQQCVDGTGGPCVSTNAVGANWSDDIWGLPGGDYPDNIDHAAGLVAELLNPASIALDTDVLIAGLVVRMGATLFVNGPLEGNLDIKEAINGRIINEGLILVGSDRSIRVPGGSFTISGQGTYAANPDLGTRTSASLVAQNVAVIFSGCGLSAKLLISNGMTVQTAGGGLVLDGSGVGQCGGSGGNAASVGGKTPPILNVGSPTQVYSLGQRGGSTGGVVPQLLVDGDFQMIEGAEVCVGCDFQSGQTLPTIVVTGDFNNQSVYPSFFRWAAGQLVFPLTGTTHRFEVAGLDLGPDCNAFQTDADALLDSDPHTNFSMHTIVVPAASEAVFENRAVNTAGLALGDEALYVRSLLLGVGSSVTVDGTTVYYNFLKDEGAQITLLNGGRLVAVICDIPAVSTWGLAALTLLVLSAATLLVSRRNPGRRVVRGG